MAVIGTIWQNLAEFGGNWVSRMGERTDGRTDRRTDGRTDGQMDGRSRSMYESIGHPPLWGRCQKGRKGRRKGGSREGRNEENIEENEKKKRKKMKTRFIPSMDQNLYTAAAMFLSGRGDYT